MMAWQGWRSLRWRLTLAFFVLMLLPTLWLYLLGAGYVHPDAHVGLNAVFVFFLGFSATIIFLGAGRIANILNEMVEVVQKLAQGQAVRLYDVHYSSELTTLAQVINQTVEQVRGQIGELRNEKSKFETVLGSMVEGVVGFDHLGRIILLNRAAEQMLLAREEAVLGKQLVEVIRLRALDDMLLAALKTGEANTRELQLWPHRSQTYRVQIVPVWSEQQSFGGAVMVLDDVSEVRRLEQVRTEFVANVSHELRTPLTSIKGFVETLRDGAVEQPEVAYRFLSIIEEETCRLQRLIEDLLQLSSIESQREQPFAEKSSLETALRQVQQLLEPLANEKNIAITFHVEKALPPVPLGPDPLRQVLVNLVENAIKYTLAGGQVSVTANRTVEGVVVEIIDTGIGIPQESLPRIFERFYRVDKARSREMGGTGLGLAIVKHLVEGCGGHVLVTSKFGQGSTFRVTLPLK
ncbi:two-component system histidine kinase PnpS [Heliophilum fasciatum]|uniref:histidine kinase n=1 Tax=Heliophilum fasciatum TaxID=35700 RepID=A0A4V2SWG0_9FIRM|nr:ATP-binding protein [Heliophilum fasciatum]MCW2278872.1 two-component system phosphate regulon sensor histidine kinase PhoR [Heliophilum fasciatum]TCP62116.1 two-component system phosphate regulon sensor histidine kinase PhoR [Heliophilum fasciatum]